MTSFSIFRKKLKKITEKLIYVLNTFEYIMEMEHLLKKSKCSIFHNIFKYMIFQRRQKELLWVKVLNCSNHSKLFILSQYDLSKPHLLVYEVLDLPFSPARVSQSLDGENSPHFYRRACRAVVRAKEHLKRKPRFMIASCVRNLFNTYLRYKALDQPDSMV